MSTMTLAANANWLDASDLTGSTVQTTLTTTNGWVSSDCIRWNYYYPVYSSPTRPIKLTLSEVERLRKAAKADEKLRAILKKFTDQIEITVDFGED